MDQPDTKPAAVSGTIILKGGDNFTVTLIDGRTHNVFIRLIPIAEMRDYVLIYDDFSKVIALATNEDVDKLKNLSEDSFYALYNRITEINDPRLDRWLRERLSAVGKFKALQPVPPSHPTLPSKIP